MSGRFEGSTTSMASIRDTNRGEEPDGCLYRPLPTAMAIDVPSISKGECPWATAKRVHPNDCRQPEEPVLIHPNVDFLVQSSVRLDVK